MPKSVRIMPLGPKRSVSAILLVKGGEIRGRIVIALMMNFTQAGMRRRVTAKAKIKPRTVPVRPTEKPSRMLLTAACWSYQLETKGLRFSKVKPLSPQKVMARSRQSG